MIQYSFPVSEAKIKEPVVRSRFIFLNRHGETDTPQEAPVGISYCTQIPTACQIGIVGGKAQYYSMGAACPVPLELGGDAVVGTRLTYDSLGRGVYACLDASYAEARQGGSVGDYISVLIRHQDSASSAFSSAFAPCQFI